MHLTRLSEMALNRRLQPAGHQRRDQSRQSRGRRYREPPPHASRAPLVGRHELHDGGGRDARAARRPGRNGRAPAAHFRARCAARQVRVREVRRGACARRRARWVPGVRPRRRATLTVAVRAGRAGAPQRHHLRRRWLRHGSVNPTDTPALYRIRTEGVDFANSHAVFPSQTMPNAAAIATGHYPGRHRAVRQHAVFGYPLFLTGKFGQRTGTLVPDVEDPLGTGRSQRLLRRQLFA